MRVCRVDFTDKRFMLQIVAAYNQKTGVLGEGRLYTKANYLKPVLLPNNLSSLYLSILDECLAICNVEGKVKKSFLK